MLLCKFATFQHVNCLDRKRAKNVLQKLLLNTTTKQILPVNIIQLCAWQTKKVQRSLITTWTHLKYMWSTCPKNYISLLGFSKWIAYSKMVVLPKNNRTIIYHLKRKNWVTRKLPYSPGAFLSFLITLEIKSEFQTETLGTKFRIGSSTSKESRYNSCVVTRKRTQSLS